MELTTKPARVTSRRATVPAARHDGRGTSWARRGIPRRDVQAFVDAQRAGRALRRRASASPSREGLPVGLRLGRQRHRRAAGIAGKAGARTTDPAEITGNDARGFGAFHRHLNLVEVGVRGPGSCCVYRPVHVRGGVTRIGKRSLPMKGSPEALCPYYPGRHSQPAHPTRAPRRPIAATPAKLRPFGSFQTCSTPPRRKARHVQADVVDGRAWSCSSLVRVATHAYPISIGTGSRIETIARVTSISTRPRHRFLSSGAAVLADAVGAQRSTRIAGRQARRI